MSERPYRVHVVVDLHYGECIRGLPAGEPAWVADSPDNHPVIQAIWQERGTLDQSTGITSFKCNASEKPDDLLVSILSAVDLHHGEYSHQPPYSVLNVIGTSWSEAIQDALDQYEFSDHEDTAEGFTARRDVHGQPSSL